MQIETALEYDTFPLNREIRVHLLLLMRSEASQASTRRPLNLSLVIDRSGSMAGKKIDYTLRAAAMLVQNLSAQDILSVVYYNDMVDTLLQPEPVQRKDIITQQIQRITPGGATNLSGGWLEGCRLTALNLTAGQVNRVLLISDGQANRGVTETEKLVNYARQKHGEGVSTTCMGLGDDFNEELLMAMSSAGGGAYYYIESPEAMPTILSEELNGLLSLVGQNLSVTASGTSVIKQMNAYPEQITAAGKIYRLGDMFGEEVKALVLQLNVPEITTEGSHEIAQLKIEYDRIHPGGVERIAVEQSVRVNVTREAEMPTRQANKKVQEQVLLLRASQARRKAVELSDAGKPMEASQVLLEVISEIDASESAQSELLQQEKRALGRDSTSFTAGASSNAASSRKRMASTAFYTSVGRHNDTVMMRQRIDQTPPEVRTGLQSNAPTLDEGRPPRFMRYNGHEYPLDNDSISLGRAVENDIIMNEKGISRLHCVLIKEHDMWWVEDTGSTNGTVVNGILIKGRHPLRVGDKVLVGEAILLFHNGELD